MPVSESASAADADGLEESLLLRRPQPGGIHDQQDVGGAHRALVPDPLEQLFVAGLDPVDPDTGRPGEVLVQRFVRLVVPRRVKIEDGLLGSTRRRGDDTQGKRGQGGAQESGELHGELQRLKAMVRLWGKPGLDVNTNANDSHLM